MSKKIFSVEELLKNPQAYHQQILLVEGYFEDEFEGQVLWPSKDAAEQAELKDSIWVDIGKKVYFFDQLGKKANRSYFHQKKVLIKGQFISDVLVSNGYRFGHGHMGGWPAEINITMMQTIN